VCSRDEGFRNPGNIAVNPVDGKLYITDRAEEDLTLAAQGLFRIDGPDLRTRITGSSDFPVAADGQLAAESFIEQPRGIAFLANGAYFLCAHKGANGANVWYVDTTGVLHLYIRGRKSGDIYNLTNDLHPPLDSFEYYSQARAVTLAPNGNLICVTNDSGYVFMVNSVAPPQLPEDLRATRRDVDGLHLGWHGIFGRGYLVERSTELAPQNWQIIGAAGGSATALEFIDPGAVALNHAFYRLAPASGIIPSGTNSRTLLRRHSHTVKTKS